MPLLLALLTGLLLVIKFEAAGERDTCFLSSMQKSGRKGDGSVRRVKDSLVEGLCVVGWKNLRTTALLHNNNQQGDANNLHWVQKDFYFQVERHPRRSLCKPK